MKKILSVSSLIIVSACTGASDSFRQTIGMDLNASPTQVENFDGGGPKSEGFNPFRPRPQPTYEAYNDSESQSYAAQEAVNPNLGDDEQFKQATALVQKGNKSGVKAMQSLADSGYTPAQYNMGVMYLTGKGVSKNQSQGVKYLRKAADRGHTKAASTIGAMYLQGQAVTRNAGQARRYLTKAAQKGDAQSMLYLSLMYNRGDGVKQDKAQAYQWLLSLPSSQNSAQLRNNQDNLAKTLSAAQKSKAESAAKSFKSRYGIS